ASMAISCLKSGNYEEAIKRAQESIDWSCTNTAHESLKIIHANALVTYALCNVYLFREGIENISEPLSLAEENLRNADKVFTNIKEKSHHLGRYFGTLVFLKIARFDQVGNGLNLDASEQSSLLKNATLTHSPIEFRTKFGRAAGLYCEAFCHYWLAKTIGNIEEHLDKAQKQLDEINNLINDNQVNAREKVECLRDAMKEIQKGYHDDPKEYQWLALPIN
ncbi:MAG: hypothetical protein ACC707_14975, partial [Thiohalomonadales bacterium]